MGRVSFTGWDWVRTTFCYRNVDPESTKYVDPGACLIWQNHADHQVRSTCYTYEFPNPDS